VRDEGAKMKTRSWPVIIILLILAASWAGAEEIEGLPLHVQKLDTRVIRLWVGDHISSTSLVAFATEKGIVVVDTFGVPKVDTRLREVIARELGRDDFAFLINTHEHRDHTGGNVVYSDCTIVGHELVAAGMALPTNQRDRVLAWYPGRIAELEEELEAADDSTAEVIKENLILTALNYEAFKAGQKPVTPTLTFSDRMTLDLGDTTFELSFIGGMHSASDAAVFVPEYGLLLTGDTMADVWLTETPGCLASFRVRDGIQHDFPRFLANWDRILAGKDRITKLLPAHWNGELSIEGAEARVEYVRTLWEGIRQASEENRSFRDVQAEYLLDVRFPELAGSPGFSPQHHYASFAEVWNEVTGQASAANALFTLLNEGAEEEAIRKIVTDYDSGSPTYIFSEVEFNAYGYAFLQQEKIDEAIRMFKINAEMNPDSWNVFDSLGEALLSAGNTNAAVAMYEKSLILNPDNTNGRKALEKIQETAKLAPAAG